MKNRPTDTYTKTEKKSNIRMKKRQMTVYNLRKFKYNQRQSLDKIGTRWLFFTANKFYSKR